MSDLSITTIDAAPIGRDIIDDRSELREEVLMCPCTSCRVDTSTFMYLKVLGPSLLCTKGYF